VDEPLVVFHPAGVFRHDLVGAKDHARGDGESIFSRSREKVAVFHTSWTDELMGVRDGK